MNKTIIKHNNFIECFLKKIKKFKDQYQSACTNIKKILKVHGLMIFLS